MKQKHQNLYYNGKKEKQHGNEEDEEKRILHANTKVAWEINKKKRDVLFPTDEERFWSTYKMVF